MSTLRVVLLGVLGHGKTFLFNKITQANEPAIYGGKSVTKQIVIGQSAKGQFEIIDTPGFEAREDKLLHAAGVIAALAQGDVNRILVVVRCERTDIMITNIKKIIGSIQRYRDLTTIIVSYWDEQQRNIIKNNKSVQFQQKQELEAKKEIELQIQNNFNIFSVIFSSLDDDPIIITKNITDIILQSQFTKIRLSDAEIYSSFDLLSLDDEHEMEFNQSIRKIKSEFRNISSLFLKYIQNLRLDEPNLIDKLHYLSLGIKRIANEKIEEFEKQRGDYMNETYDTDGINIRYLHHIYLKREIRLDVEAVINAAQAKMKECEKHCFNWIKQCPYCGLVWIKVVGCDKETTCGNRVNSSFDDLLRRPERQNRYNIVVKKDSIDVEIEQGVENKLTIQKHIDIIQILYDSVKDDTLFNMQKGRSFVQTHIFLLITQFVCQRLGFCENINVADQQIMINEFKFILRENGLLLNDQKNCRINQEKSLGCGRTIIWKDLAPLSGPLLKKLLSPELIDYFNDQEQLLKDEADDMAKELERAYKNLVNQAINESLKNIKVIQKQQSQMQTQNNKQVQNNESKQGNIMQTYQNLIQKTKIDQQNIKRRYSIKKVTGQSVYSDTKAIDTLLKQQSETQSLKTT